MTTETRKGYDATIEHRQQGGVNPIEERVNMYKRMMAEEQVRNPLAMLKGDKNEKDFNKDN